jgi:hypothetical protein
MNKRQNWWLKQSHTSRQTLFGLVTVGLFAALAGALLSGEWFVLLMFLGLQLLGAVATFVLVDQILSRNEDRKLMHCQLIPRLRSRVNTVALSAVSELSQQGWLHDGSLQGVYLSGANLQGARLRDANLQEALLVAANLQGADLFRANLQGTHFWRANLREINLAAANLTDAVLHEAHLAGAQFSEETILPDGSRWTPNTDIRRFSDPEHPDAWRKDYKPGLSPDLLMPPWGESGRPFRD